MSLIETYESRKQLIADNLNAVGVSEASADDGLTTLANLILQASGGKTLTILTLNTPMVVYTDVFTVTGTLTDNEETPISGATIQLVWNDGTEHIATGSTNSSGVFSFTSTDPASVSQYSFQLFFAGDSDYVQSSSSVVNVNTAKETSVMVITSPASGSTVSTDSVTVSGTLKDNDNTAMSGKSVSFSLNNVSAGTATVGSDGTFSKTVTGLAAGSNSISASFAATITHTTASQSITVNRSTFDGLADLELIDGSQILSYADEQATPGSQYAMLGTQLMNGDSPATISGVEVGFWDFTDDSAPVLLGSDTTNSNGKVSFTYESLGVGDVPIKAVVGTYLTKTYDIVDALYYKSNVSTGNVNIPVPSSNKWSVTYKMKHTSNGVYFNMADGNHTYFVGNFSSSGGNGVLIRNNGSSTNLVLELATDISLNTEYDVTITFDEGVWKYNHGNGEMTVTATSYIPTSISKFDIGGYIHDFILKPL